MLSYECLRATFELLIYNVKIVFSKLLDKSTVFSNMPGLNASNFSNDLVEVRKFDAQLDESGVNRWKSFIYFGKSMFFQFQNVCVATKLISFCFQFVNNFLETFQNDTKMNVSMVVILECMKTFNSQTFDTMNHAILQAINAIFQMAALS